MLLPPDLPPALDVVQKFDLSAREYYHGIPYVVVCGAMVGAGRLVVC